MPEVMHSGVMEAMVWLRMPGDIVFAAGGVFLAPYAWRLLRPATRRRAAATALPVAAAKR